MQPLAEADLHSTVLIRDGPDSPGAFLLVQALRLALGNAAGPTSGPAASRRVVLLAAAQAAGHYAAVLRKSGLNAAALMAADRLAVVDLLPLVAAAAPGPPPSLAALHPQLAAAVVGSGSNGGGGSSGQGGVCLVVDDLTALRCLAAGAADWAAFLRACLAAGAAPGCCFVGLAHGGVPDDDGWLARLEHAAALVLEVEPLESGASADTTGRVAVTRRDVAAAAAAAGAADGGSGGAGAGCGALGTRLLTYKLGDAGATYLAVQ